MVGTLVRLQLKLVWRGYTASTIRMVTTILMGLYFGGIVAAFAIGLSFLRGQPDILGPVSIGGFSVLTLLWPLGSIFISGGNALADAGRFALFPVRSRDILPGLVIAGLIGFGAVSTLILGIALTVGWSTDFRTILASLIGVCAGLLICFLLARFTTAAFSVALQRRRFKESAAIVLVAAILGGSFSLQWLSARASANVDGLVAQLSAFSQIAAWTPFGWAWSLPWHVYQGEWGLAGGKLVGCVLLIYILARGWGFFLDRDLTSPLEVGGEAQRIKQNASLDVVFPATSAGAVARRSVRYWRRDPRRFMQLVMVAIMPLFILMPLWLAPGPIPSAFLTFVPAISAVMVGSAIAWDISYDGSALWMQISAGISGRDDRLGRAMGFLFWFVPYFLVIFIVFSILGGRWDLTPGVFGVSVTGIGVGIGVGSWVGGVWQTAMPPASGNLFRTSSGGGFETFIGSMLTLIVPVLVTGVVAGMAGSAVLFPVMTWVDLVVGIGLGALFMWGGITLGGKRLDPQWPEVLKKVTWQGD